MDTQKILHGIVVVIGLVMIITFLPKMGVLSAPVLSGVAFILLGASRFVK